MKFLREGFETFASINIKHLTHYTRFSISLSIFFFFNNRPKRASIPLEFSTRRWLSYRNRIVQRADEVKNIIIIISSREVLIHTLIL